MFRHAGTVLFSAVATQLLGGTVWSVPPAPRPMAPAPQPAPQPSAGPVAVEPAEPEPPPAPTVDQALSSGVLIVISKPAQHMYVFKDGEPWGSTPVSTGRRSHPTPTGVFPILQKKVHHRSNLYGGARMPYMQRLTWDGIALHAGHVPGYPASHGCIRMPGRFARALYSLTGFTTTAVLVTDERLGSHRTAHRLASGQPLPDDEPQLARNEAGAADAWAGSGPVETIQLAASSSPEDAAAYWRHLTDRQPRLGSLEEAIIPARVNGRRVYRLRASAAGAHALCGALKGEGIACLKV